MEYPLVSCIMPTANRQKFISSAIAYFLDQDYPNKQLIILDDGKEPMLPLIPQDSKIKYLYSGTPYSTGFKRNLACEEAKGEIIIHFDDDDWYARDWISRQVAALLKSGADICGLNQINYFSTILNERWTYVDANPAIPWVYGATLAYWKSFWNTHQFEDLIAGEDNQFIYHSKGKIFPHDYTAGYLGILHQSNTGIQPFEDPKDKLQHVKWKLRILKPVIKQRDKIIFPETDLPFVSCIMPTANRQDFIPLAIKYFLDQDYKNSELIIIDDGKDTIANLVPSHPKISYYYGENLGSIGMKRNLACEKANGEIIVHLDDDDWYASDWISTQVDALIKSKADACGLNQIQLYSPSLDRYWMTRNINSKRPWISGNTLAYWKSFWKEHPFEDLQIREDDAFIRNTGAKVFAHDYYQGFMATIHADNTTQLITDPWLKD